MGWGKGVGGGGGGGERGCRVGGMRWEYMILNTVFQFPILSFFLHPVHIYQINDTIRWEWKLVCVCVVCVCVCVCVCVWQGWCLGIDK